MTKAEAIRKLLAAGEDEYALRLAEWVNHKREFGGWDGWIRGTLAREDREDVLELLWEDDRV